jgi:hypothetical protein
VPRKASTRYGGSSSTFLRHTNPWVSLISMTFSRENPEFARTFRNASRLRRRPLIRSVENRSRNWRMS